MKPVCPTCGEEIPAADVNLDNMVMLCRKCNEISPISRQFFESYVSPEFNLAKPPYGVEYKESFNGARISMKLISLSGLLVPFIIGCFLNFIGYSIVNDMLGATDADYSVLGLVAGILLFIAGVGVWFVFLVVLFGRTVVEIDGDNCRVFTGLGSVGCGKRFHLKEIRQIKWDCWGNSNGKDSYRLAVKFDGRSDIKFGMLAPDDSLEYVNFALRTFMRKDKS